MATALVGIGQATLQIRMAALQHVITAKHILLTNACQSVESLLKDGNEISSMY